MKVVTLSEPQFGYEAERIISEIKKKNVLPDLVIGIATGGAILTECMRSMENGLDAQYVEVKCQRTLTNKKKNYKLKMVLKYFPRIVNDCLRILEHHVRQFHATAECGEQGVFAKESVACSIVDAKSILIVDDAVDSGCTMYTVIDFVKNLNATAIITTAAITVTWRNPCVLPDVALYENTLIRFHWSEDA